MRKKIKIARKKIIKNNRKNFKTKNHFTAVVFCFKKVFGCYSVKFKKTQYYCNYIVFFY